MAETNAAEYLYGAIGDCLAHLRRCDLDRGNQIAGRLFTISIYVVGGDLPAVVVRPFVDHLNWIQRGVKCIQCVGMIQSDRLDSR